MQQDIKASKSSSSEEEVDLGVLYKIFSKLGKSIVGFFENLLSSIFKVILHFLFLIKRNIVWLILAALVGLSFGLYSYYKKGPSYYSEMVVKSNFESSRMLYQKIEYFNALIKERKIHEISKLFHLSYESAAKLTSFSITPIKTTLEESKIYKRNFLNYKYNIEVYDSSMARLVDYNKFISELSDYDYPLHSIRLDSRESTVFQNVQQGFVEHVLNNPTFKNIKEISQQTIRKEEAIVNASLIGIDSLRKAYNNKISHTVEKNTGEAAVGVVVGQGNTKAPEIGLYDQELKLKDELVSIRNRSIDNVDVIQVYADFSPVGKRVSKFNEELFILPLISLLIALIIVVLIDLLKQVGRMEKYLNNQHS